MSRIYIYDEAHPNERVLSYLPTANTPDYEARTDVVIYGKGSTPPTLIEELPYLRHDTGEIRDMNQTEKDALDAEVEAARITASRDGASAEAAALGRRGVRTRAILQMSVLGDNISREWLTDFKAGVAAATDLPSFKAAVAALDDMPQWTKAQAISMYRDLITSGDSDNE